MIQDKNFNLYLIDGTAQGKISCKTENWAGVAFKIPKTQIENCAEISELQHAGIYFLFSESAVSIGAGKLKSDADFWDDAIFFTYQKKSFEMTDLKFLKYKFSKKISAANRYELKSDYEIFSESIAIEKKSTLELFASYVETILYIFGYKIFEPPKEIAPVENSADTENLFYLERNLQDAQMTVKATCKRISENIYVVLAGSQISPVTAKYISDNIKKERKKAKISDENILLKDVSFKTPSGAAEFVTGLSANGWQTWKTKDGITLCDFLNRQAAEE